MKISLLVVFSGWYCGTAPDSVSSSLRKQWRTSPGGGCGQFQEIACSNSHRFHFIPLPTCLDGLDDSSKDKLNYALKNSTSNFLLTFPGTYAPYNSVEVLAFSEKVAQHRYRME